MYGLLNQKLKQRFKDLDVNIKHGLLFSSIMKFLINNDKNEYNRIYSRIKRSNTHNKKCKAKNKTFAVICIPFISKIRIFATLKVEFLLNISNYLLIRFTVVYYLEYFSK